MDSDLTIEATLGCGTTVSRHETCVSIHEDHHEGTANEKRLAPSPSIDPDQCRNRHEDIDDILNG